MAAVVDPAMCLAMSQLPCVFLIALGRTGSSHLLRLLNGIDGYRLSGETDNAWIYMGWFAGARANARAYASERRGPGPRSSRESHAALSNRSDVLCQARQMMVMLHNPLPRARCVPCAHRPLRAPAAAAPAPVVPSCCVSPALQ